MRSEKTLQTLTDIKRNVGLVRMFVQGMDYEDFAADVKTVYAVTRCLEIVSEASRRLPSDLKARHPHIPWNDVAGAGNVYRHDYEDILEPDLWDTIHLPLDSLETVVLEELARLTGRSD
ncbi:HepT-like ribonuclease domain-containing protein [Rhodoplanes roseus]|uniref:DUF86 domain-containing protein n=1 Tax=Rhodoplanes roseus TaxID=29409 RepID=A0A327KM14_9BRAD|nr:HepT-like ribonuclease domain-containing protein [Rhodoplanes roseus]RAI39321.1 hypothetical protein CH341_26075 [Rhodoplanes roseus]